VLGSVGCAASTMGGDPAVGFNKYCMCTASSGSLPLVASADRCVFSSPVVGALESNNIGEAHLGKSLAECKALCIAEPTCQSIDYVLHTNRCVLGSAQIGQPEKVNNGDTTAMYYACSVEVIYLPSQPCSNPASGATEWTTLGVGHCYQGHIEAGSGTKDSLDGCKAGCVAEGTCSYVSYNTGDKQCSLYSTCNPGSPPILYTTYAGYTTYKKAVEGAVLLQAIGPGQPALSTTECFAQCKAYQLSASLGVKSACSYRCDGCYVGNAIEVVSEESNVQCSQMATWIPPPAPPSPAISSPAIPAYETCAIGTNDESRLGMWSGGVFLEATAAGATVLNGKWLFILAIANSAGKTDIWLGDESTRPSKVGTVAHVCSGASFAGIGSSTQGAGIVSKAFQWDRAITLGEIQHLYDYTKDQGSTKNWCNCGSCDAKNSAKCQSSLSQAIR